LFLVIVANSCFVEKAIFGRDEHARRKPAQSTVFVMVHASEMGRCELLILIECKRGNPFGELEMVSLVADGRASVVFFVIVKFG